MEKVPMLPMHSAGRVPRVAKVQAIVIYDSKTGVVRHLHQGITLEGARPSDAEALERRALETAEKMGVKLKGTKTLHVPEILSVRGPFRVEVQTRHLVPLDAPERRTGPRPARGKKKAK